MQRILILALTAAVGVAVSAPACAQSVSMKAYPDVNLAGFSGEPSALPNAVAAAEAASGGRVVAIRYDNVAGVSGYDVVLARGTNVTFERFSNPSTGLVAFTSNSKPAWMLKWPARKDVSIVTHAKVPLSQAIRTAEAAHAGAPAVAAGLAVNAVDANVDVHAYNVVLLVGGHERRVAIDSETGLRIADPNILVWP
jgi:hypothetical protein